MSIDNDQGPHSISVVPSLKWRYVEDLPETADIYILIAGLIGISPDADGNCQLGFAEAPDHTPELTWMHGSYKQTFTKAQLGTEVLLDSGAPTKVGFYSLEGKCDEVGVRDNFDFNWIIDFERMFPGKVKVIQGSYSSVFKIKNGTFFSAKTASKFTIYKNGSRLCHSSVGLFVGAKLAIPEGGQAKLTFNRVEIDLLKTDSPHFLFITNVCSSSSTPNMDVGEYRNTFTVDDGPPDYDVAFYKKGSMTPAYTKVALSTLFDRAGSEPDFTTLIEKILNSDRVPCGAVGFGGGGPLT